MSASLSQADVARLMDDPSPAHRAETAAKVASQFEEQKLSEPERKIAEDIFRTCGGARAELDRSRKA